MVAGSPPGRRTRARLKGLHHSLPFLGDGFRSLGDYSGGWLRGQLEVQLVEQHLVILLRLGVSGKNQEPPIGRGQPHIHHLDRGHFLQHRSSRQSRRQSPQPR